LMNRGDILTEAARLTSSDRQNQYGDPRINHSRIAQLWTTYLETEIEPDQVAICMALVKIARLMETQSADSYIDLAAYAAIAGEIAMGKR
jgi:hypothetical protein